MGMFDSFYTNEGKEIQTKKLNNELAHYHLGDTAPNYELNFDGATGNYYLIEDYFDASVIVINNIFIDYLIDEDHEKLKISTAELFKVYLSNHELLSLKLSNVIKEKLNSYVDNIGHKGLRTQKKIEYPIIRTYITANQSA